MILVLSLSVVSLAPGLGIVRRTTDAGSTNGSMESGAVRRANTTRESYPQWQ